VATPSTDPYSMLMLAVPMLVLVLASELISRVLDYRRGRGSPTHWDDDAQSPL
jgi:sec-independent protein translocase protein TatC